MVEENSTKPKTESPYVHSPLTEWENEPTVLDLKEDLQNAQSDHNAATQRINSWLDHLNITGEAKPKTKKGRSSIQPRLIRKQAEWRYSSLSEPFLSTPDLFDINPVTYEDKAAAQQNALLLNNQFNTKLDKVKFINEYVRTGVNEGTIIVKLGWENEEEDYEEEEPVFELRPAKSQEEIAAIQSLAQMAQANPQQFQQEIPVEFQEALTMSMQNNAPYFPEQTGTETVEKTRIIKNQPSIEICDYKSVVVDPTCKGDLSKANFIIHSFETSMSELKRDGRYTNLDKILIDEASPLRDPDSQYGDAPTFRFKDEPRKIIMAHEYWGYWDIDGSGIVKPIVATFVGQTMIRMEENPFPDGELPFVLVKYLPTKNAVYGEADAELLVDNQKIAGAVTRGMIDIMGRSANGQIGARKDALDVVNRRKFIDGEDYEYNPNVDPRMAFYQHTYPEIPESAHVMLQYQNNEAEALTGVKAFSQGISGQALGTTATGVRSALDATAKRDLDILRRLSQGLEKIGRKIIAMNSAFLSEEEIVRVTNEEFVPIRRDDLKGNFDLRLTISTAEADNQKAQELSFMLQTLGPNTSFDVTKLILADIAKLRKMPTLAKRIEEYQPQPDPVQQQLQQLELMKLQAEIEKIKSETMHKGTGAQLNSAKAVSEQAKAVNIQSETDLNNLEYVEEETGTKHERELQKQQAQAMGNAQLEVVKAQLARAANNDNQGQ
tara:strand:+ start:26671 stop:28830 length:2160 start_codon:yes stop_codon:yes gene_type:complete